MATDYAQRKWPFGVSEVCTASNIFWGNINDVKLLKLVETRTVLKSSSRFERVNKLDTELLVLENVITCFSPEMPFVIRLLSHHT